MRKFLINKGERGWGRGFSKHEKKNIVGSKSTLYVFKLYMIYIYMNMIITMHHICFASAFRIQQIYNSEAI